MVDETNQESSTWGDALELLCVFGFIGFTIVSFFIGMGNYDQGCEDGYEHHNSSEFNESLEYLKSTQNMGFWEHLFSIGTINYNSGYFDGAKYWYEEQAAINGMSKGELV